MATTTVYAYERIYEVLVDGAGTNRALIAANRFVRGYPPGFSPDMRATRAKAKPAVFVVIGAAAVEPFASGEISDAHDYRITVAIYRDHWLGYEGDYAEVEAQLVSATNAFFRVRAALCWPGNLALTAESKVTGIAGQALNGAGATTKISRVDSIGTTGRLLQFVDTFSGEFEFSPDA